MKPVIKQITQCHPLTLSGIILSSGIIFFIIATLISHSPQISIIVSFFITGALLLGVYYAFLRTFVRSEKIALVSNDPLVTKQLITIINKLKLSLVVAVDHPQALKQIEQFQPLLVLLDLEENLIENRNLLSHIRGLTDNCRIPIIALSSSLYKEKKMSILAADFDDIIGLPAETAEVNRILMRWLHREETTVTSSEAPEEKTTENSPEPEASAIAIDKVVDIQEALSYSRNDKALARDLLVMLIESLQQHEANLHEYYASESWDSLQELVHQIRGGSCYCGVSALHQGAEKLDDALEKKDYDEVKKRYPEFIQATTTLLKWNDEYDVEILFE